MQKMTINYNGPEVEFILCRNVSGVTLSQGAAVYFDTAAVTDGFAISGARTGQKFLFAGIAAQALASNSTSQAAKGFVQCYGIASAYVQFSTSAISAAPGTQLDSVQSATYLTEFTPVSATSLVPTVANPWNFVTLMEAVASAAAGSTPVLHTVFIRAM